MAASPLRELHAEAFVHATESEDRVARALGTAAPGARVQRTAVGGHFGQSLVRLTATSTDPACIQAAVEALRGGCGDEIARGASRRISEDLVLHLRLDKQAAAGGALRLHRGGQGDVIVVRLRLRAPRLTAREAVALVQATFGSGRPSEEE